MYGNREICLRDRSYYHYNAHVAAIDINGNMMVTCQNSSNDYDGTKSANMFMGLTLYDLRHNFVRTDGSSYNNSDPLHVPFLVHVDMLHEGPNCSGVVNINKEFEHTDTTNRYLHTDNINAQIMVTDFKDPHGPGSMDHSSANVERIYGIPLSSQMGGVTADPMREIAYVADTARNSVIEVYYKSGSATRSARGDYPIFSSIDEKFVYLIREHVTWKNVAQIIAPTSLALHDFILYILNRNSTIFMIDTRDFRQLGHFQLPFEAHSLERKHDELFIVSTNHIYVYGLEEQNYLPCDIDCRTKYLNEACEIHHECQSFNCTNSVCVPYKHVVYNETNNLAQYLSSDVYNRSFVSQHILTGGLSTYANYLNLYPIMEQDFCSTVGNNSGVPDCDLIDFDSLLLGNCWGHPCLPNHLHCMNGGTVMYKSSLGYECECGDFFQGDTCQHVALMECIDLRKKYQDASCCRNTNCTVIINTKTYSNQELRNKYQDACCSENSVYFPP